MNDDDSEKINEENMSIRIDIPKNDKEAIETGAGLGRELFSVASRMRASMIEGGSSIQCAGNALLHAHIIALSYIATVVIYEMEGAPIPSFDDLEERNMPIFKKLVDSIADIITENAKRGRLIRFAKDAKQKGDD
jgi:hypothetical protein